MLNDITASTIIWQDADRKLSMSDGQPTLQYKGKTYTFGCQPYEPMAIIKLDEKPVAYLHNAFDPDVECQEFLNKQNYLVHTISGRHHDAERFCRLLSTAAEFGFDRDVDKAEDKMLELLVQEKGVKTIQFETRDFHRTSVLYEGVCVMLGYFENALSKANGITRIYGIAFGFPDRNHDYYEYYLLSEHEYSSYMQRPERRRWKNNDEAFHWLSLHLKGTHQVLCNEFKRNPSTYKPYFRLDEIPYQKMP